MNQLVSQISQTQLPAHLQKFAGLNLASDIMQGINMGSSIYQIGIKQAKWRLQDPQGAETMVPTHHLDVLIVGVNPNISKVYYAKKYNPADTEAKAPDCYSDNGQTPSARASSPQSVSCAQCPHNVWGSKVNDNGSETKACADSRKIAVVLADNPTGPVYLLRIPAASLKNSVTYAESLSNRGIPLPAIITRLGFDPEAEYPKITFTPTGWAGAQQAEAVQEALGSEEVYTVVGLKEQAAAPKPVAPAPKPVAIAPAPAPSPVIADKASVDPFAALAAPAQTKPKQTRARVKVESEPVADIQTSNLFDQLKAKPDNAAAAVVVHPQTTDSALDALIGQALSV